MNLDKDITLTNASGSLKIPLINLMRVTLVKLEPIIKEYFRETKDPTAKGLVKYIAKKLGVPDDGKILL